MMESLRISRRQFLGYCGSATRNLPDGTAERCKDDSQAWSASRDTPGPRSGSYPSHPLRGARNELGRYAGSNENFVLVRTGITAVLSFEFAVLSEDGNRLYSKLRTQHSKRQGLA